LKFYTEGVYLLKSIMIFALLYVGTNIRCVLINTGYWSGKKEINAKAMHILSIFLHQVFPRIPLTLRTKYPLSLYFLLHLPHELSIHSQQKVPKWGHSFSCIF